VIQSSPRSTGLGGGDGVNDAPAGCGARRRGDGARDPTRRSSSRSVHDDRWKISHAYQLSKPPRVSDELFISSALVCSSFALGEHSATVGVSARSSTVVVVINSCACVRRETK